MEHFEHHDPGSRSDHSRGKLTDDEGTLYEVDLTA